ncbi:MAG: hypothetical protein ACRYF5_13155, partial [Janthinobacterium lividum]
CRVIGCVKDMFMAQCGALVAQGLQVSHFEAVSLLHIAGKYAITPSCCQVVMHLASPAFRLARAIVRKAECNVVILMV